MKVYKRLSININKQTDERLTEMEEILGQNRTYLTALAVHLLHIGTKAKQEGRMVGIIDDQHNIVREIVIL